MIEERVESAIWKLWLKEKGHMTGGAVSNDIHVHLQTTAMAITAYEPLSRSLHPPPWLIFSEGVRTLCTINNSADEDVLLSAVDVARKHLPNRVRRASISSTLGVCSDLGASGHSNVSSYLV